MVLMQNIWIPFVTVQSAAKLPRDLSFRNLALIEPLYLAVRLARKGKPGDNVVISGVELMVLERLQSLKREMLRLLHATYPISVLGQQKK